MCVCVGVCVSNRLNAWLFDNHSIIKQIVTLCQSLAMVGDGTEVCELFKRQQLQNTEQF